MTRNYYDQASRYAAKLDPPGFVGWVLRSAQVVFHRWLDTRRLPFPGEADRTCDTVAELEDSAEPGVLWAVPIEFTLEPDGDLGFRLLVYEGQIALDERPSVRPGDRYRIGACVVNLTGAGQTSLDMRLGATGVGTGLWVGERNLSQEDAALTLAAIAATALTRALLPFVPLMQGGADPAIMQEWIRVASAEPDARRRGDYGGLALVFADAVGRRPAWRQALGGWNVVQSPQVLEWMAEGEVRGELRGKLTMLLRFLRSRFGPIPADLEAAIRAVTDPALLEQWADLVGTAPSLQAFRQAAQV